MSMGNTEQPVEATGVSDKGLSSGALRFLDNVTIGVAATAPGASIALVLGFAAAVVGFQSPAILVLAFVPILFIAAAYYYLNRAHPDCGTSFSWVTKSMGPYLGWLTGWAMVVALLIIMANLAQLSGAYTFLLFGWDSAAESTFAVTLAGVAWIAILTWIAFRGVALAARTQLLLLSLEVVTLAVFAAVALFRVYVEGPAGSVRPELSWYNPFAVDSWGAVSAGLVLAILIYWGWDSTVSTNEESEGDGQNAGRAAVVSTVILVGIYVVVATAALAFGGLGSLVDNPEEVLSALGTRVFGSPLDKLLVIAVLTSAAASTQSVLLESGRTVLSMARHGAAPAALGEVHRSHRTPHVATLWFGLASVVWYVGLTLVSENILFDSLAAIGLLIAFYYGLTGFACPVYYRRELTKSAKNFVMIGAAPVIGASVLMWVLAKSAIDLANPANSASGNAWLGIGPPLVIGVGFFALGIVLVLLQSRAKPAFFRRRTEVADPRILAQPPAEARDVKGS